MKALTFSRFGGPEVLEYLQVPDAVPGPGELVLATRAIGLNFSDLERRKGTYPVAGKAPYIAGYEAAGVVVQAPEASGFRVGDRIAVTDVPFTNAELVRVPLTHAIPLPAEVSFETAASSLLQGLTGQYLVRDSYPLAAGETVIVHGAAGGVGQFLTRHAVLLGARVIGLTTADAKRDLILAQGAAYAWNLRGPWKDQALELTGGKGVDVVYDSIGSTLADSFAATRIGGRVVIYGFAGGPPPLVDPRMLMDTSKTLTGGDLWGYLTSHGERVRRADELWRLILSGRLEVVAPTVFPLSAGREAHEFLESGRSAGKVLLVPG